MEFYLLVLTLHLLWSILFIFCVLVPHGMNEIVFLGKRRGRVQEVVAYSDAISTMLNLFSSFTDDKIILQAITVHDDFIIILSQYIIF